MNIHPKPKPTKAGREKKHKAAKPRRKILEMQLEAMVKQIVFWRDGSECVERGIDGGRCNSVLQWGHFIPRHQSRHLKYDLATFCQCGSHNYLHDKGAQTMGVWFTQTFGATAAFEIDRIAREHANTKQPTIQELEDLLVYYDELYQGRKFVKLELNSLVAAGYYGEIIKSAWMQDGRL